MYLGDIKVSLRMRDVIASIAASVVEQLRPEERIGKVFSYDALNRTAKILFAGENIDSLVTVHVAQNMKPSEFMITGYATLGYAAPGNLVRIAGKPGNYYITDYINGSPDIFFGKNVGFIQMWPGATVPSNDYLFLRGQSFTGKDYPALAAILGDTYGTRSGDTYYLPNFNARSPVGVGDTAGIAGNTNNYSLGQKWGDERLPIHAHGGSTGGRSAVHYHRFPSYGYTNAFGWTDTGGLYLFPLMQTGVNGPLDTPGEYSDHTHAFTTNNQGSGDKGNVHPVLGINYIIKGR